jgi:hypothetical protein
MRAFAIYFDNWTGRKMKDGSKMSKNKPTRLYFDFCNILIKKFKKSGLIHKEFVKQYSVRVWTFWKWLYHIQRQNKMNQGNNKPKMKKKMQKIGARGIIKSWGRRIENGVPYAKNKLN